MSTAKEVVDSYRRRQQTAQLQLRISQDLKQQVLTKCDRERVPYAYVVRKALEDWVREPSEEQAAA